MSDKESIKEKLLALGFQTASDTKKPNVETAKYPIEKVISKGKDVFSPLGYTFIIDHLYKSNHLHGNIKMSLRPKLQTICQWAKFEDFENLDIEKFVFIDTETSGLSSGAGTLVFLVGAGYFENDQFIIRQFFLREPNFEPAMLESFVSFFEKFDYIVSYNGKTFDIPVLRNRFILNKFSFPYDEMPHVDLLQLVRKIWRYRLPSRRLGEMEKQVMNFFRTDEEVPGWLVPQFYFDYLQSGDARPLGGVVYHNEIDILSLAALFLFAAELLVDPVNNPKIDPRDLFGIGRVYEDLGFLEIAENIFRSCLKSSELPENLQVNIFSRLGLKYKRRGKWKTAIELWENAAILNDIEAMIEIAKYFEHKNCNFHKAKAWSQKAIKLCNAPESTFIKNEIEHRINRLNRKIETCSSEQN